MKYLNHSLDYSLVPLGKRDKCFFGLLGALDIGSKFAGAIADYASVKDSNKTNLQIAREANQFNQEQWQREAAWNERMWNMTNEYNDPAMQMQRYRNAGLNPFLMMDNSGDAGVATSQSAPSGHPSAVPHVEPLPLGDIGRGFADSLKDIYQFKLQEEQIGRVKAEKNLIESQSAEQKLKNKILADDVADYGAERQARFSERSARQSRGDYDTQHYKDLLSLSGDEKDAIQSHYDVEKLAVDIAIGQRNLQSLQQELTRMQIDQSEKRFIEEIATMQAQQYMYRMSGLSSGSQSSMFDEQTVRLQLENVGIKSQGELDELIRKFEKIKAARKLLLERNTKGWFSRVLNGSEVVGDIISGVLPILKTIKLP